MSPTFFLVLLLVLVAADLYFLRALNRPDAFKQCMRVPRWAALFYPPCFLAVLVFPALRENGSPLLVLFGMTFYLLKRLRLTQEYAAAHPDISSFSSDQENKALFSEAIGIVLYWLAGMVLLIWGGIEIIEIIFPAESRLRDLSLVTVVSSVYMVFLILRSLRRFSRLNARDVFGLSGGGQPVFRLLILPVLTGFVFAGISLFVILGREVQPSTPMGEAVQSTQSSLVFMWFLFVAVMLAPFFEEIIFRGYFFFVIRRFAGEKFAVCSVAAVFALLHVSQYWGDGAAILVVAILGLILTLFRARTGSSLPGIIIHYVYNGTMTLVPIIFLIFSNPVYFEYTVKYDFLDSTQKEALLKESINRFPDHAYSYNDLAWLYAEEDRNLDQALEMADRALSFLPEEAAFLDTKAEVLYKMGRVEKTVALTEEILERSPSSEHSRDKLDEYRQVLEGAQTDQ